LDLNLLGALDVLLELRNVTRAAERLGLSQSALSAALARLRDHFDDELLVVEGRRMHPTPFAEQLLPPLRTCLAAADAFLQTSRTFDSSTATRTFRIVSSDYAHAALLVDLARKLATTAPGVSFEFILPGESSTEALIRGEMDLLISPPEYIAGGHPTELLYEENFVVAGWRGNPIFEAPLDTDQIFSTGQIAVLIGSNRRPSFADRQMDVINPGRKVVAVAASFTMVAAMLVGTPHVALMHRRLARVMAAQLPITFAEPPFAFPAMKEMAQYHRTRVADAGIRWLIDEIRETAVSRNRAASVAAPRRRAPAR
jgi:DNA-binding transcriptional LysR family regulator